MASITSLSNSSYNTSSIYGNRNVLSGLASGMDTESMIENAVSGIKLKIQNLQIKRTKIEWQQEAYRSIIDKAVNFNNKYTSYASKTNLLSNSFFSNAVNTTALGTYADKLSASGKTTSDVRINAVKQLASAASYTVSGLGGLNSGEISGITGKDFDITGDTPVSTISGTLTFKYGGTNGASFDIKFDELENLDEIEVFDENGDAVADPTKAQQLAQAIQNKLKDITYNYTKNGFKETTTADQAIKVKVDGMKISFEDGLGNGNKVSVGATSGDIGKTLGIGKTDTEIELNYDTKFVEDKPTSEYLADKELGITFNGTTKKINMGDVIKAAGLSDFEDKESGNIKFKIALQKELDDAFGAGKINVSVGSGKLVFTPSGKGDTLSVGGSAVEALGFESGDSNFINPSKKIADLLGDKAEDFFANNRLKGEFEDPNAKGIEKKSPNGSVYYVDEKGNRVDKDGFRIDSEGKSIYDFKINGAQINVTEDTTLESLMNSINSNAEAGMKVSYSKLTNEFKFTATETGANSKVEFGGLAEAMFVTHNRSASDSFSDMYDLGVGAAGEEIGFNIDGVGTYSFNIKDTDSVEDIAQQLNDLLQRNHGKTASFDKLSGQLVITDDKTGKALDFKLTSGDGTGEDDFEFERPEFGASYTRGQDAIMDVEINGKRFENFSRSSNSVDFDGMTVNLKGTFEAKPKEEGKDYEPVTFNTTTDSDKIIEAIRSFVDDYNEMATEIKNAYSTMPAQKSNGARYEPLTAEQEDSYSESELKAYNEKAKQGILFGDSNMSNMYSKLLSAITPGGENGQILREIGIKTSYNDGMTTLSLDEDALRNALESDPDKVRNAFTKTTEGGSSSDGLMQTMKNTLDTYVKTTGEPKGVLITHAGSAKAYTSLNQNSLKTQMDNIDNQIDRWQDKMATQIDRYTTKFSRLEQLIAQMNSQASSMAGLMGGSTGGY